MPKINTSDFRPGLKFEMDSQPFLMISSQFVKPGKGNAFCRTRIRNLLTGRIIEKTFKSGEQVDEVDIKEEDMRLLYTDHEGATFMDDNTYEQLTLTSDKIEEVKLWMMEDLVYRIIFYKGEAITIEPPTFIEMEITQTDPGERGDTASGKVLKPATVVTGAIIQVPIFIDTGELIKVDTRTGEYVSRVKK
jgi:elongation factor P